LTPGNVKFSICPDVSGHNPKELVDRAVAYENAGFDAIFEVDHILPWNHSNGHGGCIYIMLEAYLQQTKSIMCGATVLAPIGIRHWPLDVAFAFATMGVLHPGRVALTVGAGEAMNEKASTGIWFSAGERVARLEEAIQLIKMYWTSKDYINFKGKYFKAFGFLYDKPPKPIPLFCAAGGPKTAEIAGKYCDGFCSVARPPNFYKDVLIPHFDKAAKSVGKDPDKLEKMAFVSTFYHPDRDKAFKAARLFGGLLIPECYHYVHDPRVIEARAWVVSDEALALALNVGTTPDDLIGKFEAFIKAGCNHIILADGSPDGSLIPKICKDRIIPYFKEQYSEKR
jgi:coenzyme F420-dependent glucose-6-phosphate dehydrogenase